MNIYAIDSIAAALYLARLHANRQHYGESRPRVHRCHQKTRERCVREDFRLSTNASGSLDVECMDFDRFDLNSSRLNFSSSRDEKMVPHAHRAVIVIRERV